MNASSAMAKFKPLEQLEKLFYRLFVRETNWVDTINRVGKQNIYQLIELTYHAVFLWFVILCLMYAACVENI